MGSNPFQKDDRISVSACVCHLAEANSNALQDAVLYAIFSNTSIAKNILDTIGNGMSHYVDQFYAYGKNNYTLGLPTASYEESPNFAETDVNAAIAIDTARSYGVVLNFSYTTILTPVLMIAPYLFSARNWNPQTNYITVIPEEFIITTPHYTPGNIVNGIGAMYSPVYVEGWVDTVNLNDDYTEATIAYIVENYWIEEIVTETLDPYTDDVIYTSEYVRHVLQTDTFTDTQALPVGLNYGNDYCIAYYYVLDSEGTPSEEGYWWYYDISTELYPNLVPSKIIDASNDMLPVVPIRYQNAYMTIENNPGKAELIESSQALLKKIGLDMYDLCEALDESPDAADIDHAYVCFGVNLQTEEVASIQYLAEFFDYISDKGQTNVFTHINSLFAPRNGSNQKVDTLPYSTYKFNVGTKKDTDTAIHDVSWDSGDTATTMSVTSDTSPGFDEYGLIISISYSYIKSEILSGSIGAVGHATKEFVPGSYSDGSSIFRGRGTETSVLILRVQITTNSYKQITVKGLIHRNQIYHENVFGAVFTPLSAVIDNEEELNFIIPIHYNLAQKLTLFNRSQLYSDSLILVLNSVVIQSFAWYETHFFKVVITMAAIVISIYTGGTGEFLRNLVAATAAGLGAFTVFILKTILISYAISKGLEWVAIQIGPEVMAILSVALLALGGYMKYAKIKLPVILGHTAPTALQLMGFSVAMLESANSAMSKLITGVADEMAAFETEKESKLEELEKYTALLDEEDTGVINLLEAQAYSTTLYQPGITTPGDFYDLAVHLGNPGVLSLSVPMTYFDLALTLPVPDTPV